MQCQFCGNPATVHLTDIVNKVKREQHLCEACAREQGLIPEEHPPQLDVKALMNLLMGLGLPTPSPLAVPAESDGLPVCTACGMKYTVFRAEGRLGCAHDYDVFREHLEPLLERIHRSTTHDGKTPAVIRRHRTRNLICDLKRQLQAAVKEERYEDAARIRDLIREKEASDEPR